MRKTIAEFLRTSHTCLIFVSSEIRRLQDTTNELLATFAWPHIPLGREISAALLPETPQRWSHVVQRCMRARMREFSPGPVLISGIDILFEPTLSLDPLRLFCDLGRTTRLAVTWPGSYQHDVLAYAVPEHSHYRTWRKPEVYIVDLQQTTAFGS